MKNFVSFLFVKLIHIKNFKIGFDDIAKLSKLIEHDSFQQEEYGDNFFEFLGEHYGEEFINHSTEHEEHENLPFKHDQQTCHQSPTIFMPQFIDIELKEYLFIDSGKTFFYKESFSLFEKPTVFQPPRLA